MLKMNEFKFFSGGAYTPHLPQKVHSSITHHGYCGNPNTFSHNKQTSFELAQGKVQVSFPVPLD